MTLTSLWIMVRKTKLKLRVLARLDYDSREDMREGVRRMRFVYYAFGQSHHRFFLTRHRTRRGWHMQIFSTLKLTNAEIVALQAILNSDYKREAFNLFRVHQMAHAPLFWHALPNWNILHAEKLK